MEKLFIDKSVIASEIVTEAEGFLRIDNKDCIPILPFPLDRLKTKERILVEVGTSYLCFAAGVRDVSSISRSSLQKRCRITSGALRSRLSELRILQYIESLENGEEITTMGLIQFREIIRRLKTEEASRERGNHVKS